MYRIIYIICRMINVKTTNYNGKRFIRICLMCRNYVEMSMLFSLSTTNCDKLPFLYTVYTEVCTERSSKLGARKNLRLYLVDRKSVYTEYTAVAVLYTV